MDRKTSVQTMALISTRLYQNALRARFKEDRDYVFPEDEEDELIYECSETAYKILKCCAEEFEFHERGK